MFANKSLLLAGFLLLASVVGAGAAVPTVTGGTASFEGTAAFQETVEARCTICHTRERVDEAMRMQRDVAPLLQHMIERGAILSERDRKVLGTFWGSPLKGEAEQGNAR